MTNKDKNLRELILNGMGDINKTGLLQVGDTGYHLERDNDKYEVKKCIVKEVYLYENMNNELSIRYEVIPFDGKLSEATQYELFDTPRKAIEHEIETLRKNYNEYLKGVEKTHKEFEFLEDQLLRLNLIHMSDQFTNELKKENEETEMLNDEQEAWNNLMRLLNNSNLIERNHELYEEIAYELDLIGKVLFKEEEK